MLKALTISRYRGIRAGTLTDLGGINLFVGKNGSGKSTVLEAIYAPAPQFAGNPQALQSRRNINYPSDNYFYGRDVTSPVTVTFQLNGEKPETLVHTLGAQAPNQSFQLSFNPLQNKLHPAHQAFFKNMRLIDTRDLLDKAIEQQTFSNAVKQRKDRELVKVLNEIYALHLESLTYVQDRNEWVLRPLFSDRDFALDLDDLGAGIRITLRLLLITLLATGSAVLVEEFDAYQHVDALNGLAAALLTISDRQNVQLFLTTHSLETVQSFIGADKKHGKSMLRVFQTDLGADGTFRCANLHTPEAERLINAGVDLRKA